MINLIACLDLNRAIGYQNQLLVKLPEDMKHFKDLTTDHKVIMGYNTAISLPGPLPNRENIVITKNHKNDLPDGFDTSWRIEDIIHRFEFSKEEVFIIGGQSMYEFFISFANTLYITKVYKKFKNVDSYFPIIDINDWSPKQVGKVNRDNKSNIEFIFYKFTSRREQIYGGIFNSSER